MDFGSLGMAAVEIRLMLVGLDVAGFDDSDFDASVASEGFTSSPWNLSNQK